MSIVDAPAELVERQFGERLGYEVRLVHRRLAGEGLSDETGVLSFERTDGRPLRLVVRLFRPGTVARHEVHPERLYRLLGVLSDIGLPVPRPLWFDPSPDLFGAAYSTVSWVPGEAVVPWSAEGREFLATLGAGPVGERFCQVLAEIHAVDWRAGGLTFLDVPGAGTAFAEGKVAELGAYLSRVGTSAEPVLTDGLGWLGANLPEARRISLVHGDYRAGNMLFDGDRISAVLDWEFAMLGDPLYDLGWVCSPSNSTGSRLVCMLLPQRDFLRWYERHSGTEVDRDALRFWVTYHQVRHAVMWLEAGMRFETGKTDDLRLARMHYRMPAMRKMVAELLVNA